MKVCQICFLQIGADFKDKIFISSFAATYDNWISLEKYIYMYLTYVFYEKIAVYVPFLKKIKVNEENICIKEGFSFLLALYFFPNDGAKFHYISKT